MFWILGWACPTKTEPQKGPAKIAVLFQRERDGGAEGRSAAVT